MRLDFRVSRSALSPLVPSEQGFAPTTSLCQNKADFAPFHWIFAAVTCLTSISESAAICYPAQEARCRVLSDRNENVPGGDV